MSSFVLGGVESEGRIIVRKRKVVVDCLRDVNVGDRVLLCLEELGDSVCSGSGIIATYGNQKFDVVLGEKFEVEVVLKIGVGWLETAHLKIRTATVEVGVSLVEIEILDARSL